MATKRRRKKTKPLARLLPVLLVLILIALAGVSWYLLRERRLSAPAQPPAELKIDDRLLLLARRLGATENDIRSDDPIVKRDGVFVRSWYLTLPSQEAVAALVAVLEAEGESWQVSLSFVEPVGNDTVRLHLDAGVETFDLHLRSRPRTVTAPPVVPTVTPRPTVRPSPHPQARGRLAVLLDDGGQSLDLVQQAAALPPQVAISVLPFLPASVATAVAIHNAGHQVWLHLPMEPVDSGQRNPGPGAVLTTMSESDIRFTVRAALNNLPHVVGVNNHMGSRATTDLRTMTWVMQEISARDLAFLDSRTAADTVAEEAARAQGINTGRRHIFLDNERSPSAIRRQLDEAVYRSRIEGEIIAIGHLTSTTIKVLQEELPKLTSRGANLVPPTELLR